MANSACQLAWIEGGVEGGESALQGMSKRGVLGKTGTWVRKLSRKVHPAQGITVQEAQAPEPRDRGSLCVHLIFLNRCCFPWMSGSDPSGFRHGLTPAALQRAFRPAASKWGCIICSSCSQFSVFLVRAASSFSGSPS